MKLDIFWLVVQLLVTGWNFYVFVRNRRLSYLAIAIVLAILNIVNIYALFK